MDTMGTMDTEVITVAMEDTIMDMVLILDTMALDILGLAMATHRSDILGIQELLD